MGDLSQLDAAGVPGEIRVVDITASTLDDVRELARAGAAAGTAVAARVQSQGRGRRGHAWRSPAGGLYLSVLLRPQVPVPYFVGLPAVCALGCLRALREASGLGRIGIKWPNDLVIDNRKLAGLLVEAGSGESGAFAVLGVGVNLEPPADDAPEGVAACERGGADAGAGETDGAAVAGARPLEPTWLAREASDALPAFEELATLVRDRVMDACDQWEGQVRAGRAQAGPLAPVLDEYFDSVPMLGHQVVAYSPEGAELCRGVLSAVDAWGRVTVHVASGQDVVLAAEQASLRQGE